MTKFTVFYSWQSDLPRKINRSLIQTALEKAAERITDDGSIDIDPVIDRDTLGEIGSPSIDEVIFKKIADAQVYVADISIINQEQLALAAPDLDEEGRKKLRPTPNPNVLLELGFAVRALGWEKIILVYNESTGDPRTDLPFDLRQKRRVVYSSSPAETDRATPRDHLANVFESAFRGIAELPASHSPAQTPGDEVIESVENLKPARKARIRGYWSWIFQELRRIEPDLKSNPPDDRHLDTQIADLVAAIVASSSLVKEWVEVCESIALMGDTDAGVELTRGFEHLIQELDNKPGFSGYSSGSWFDFWKWCGYELYLTWIGCLLKEQQWKLMDTVLAVRFQWKYHQGGNKASVLFDQLSGHIHLLNAMSLRDHRQSCRADIVASRYGVAGIGSRLSLQELLDADLFLSIAGGCRIGKGSDEWTWKPWSCLYLKNEPRFLSEAKHHGYAEGLKLVFSESDPATIVATMRQELKRLPELWHDGFLWDSPITTQTLAAFDTID